jgi:hypothetical protein
MTRVLWIRRSAAGVAAVVAASVAAVGAGTPATAGAATCPPPPDAVRPFVAWNDAHDYVLTTGGSFEPGAAPWTLSGGAAVVADDAPNALDGPGHSRGLYLPTGSSVTSACVTAPKIVGIVRFFVKSTGAADGALRVEVLVKGSVYQAGTITAGSTWAPSPMLASDAPSYKGAVTYQVRLTPVGPAAAFTVDDVYFDPYRSR